MFVIIFSFQTEKKKTKYGNTKEAKKKCGKVEIFHFFLLTSGVARIIKEGMRIKNNLKQFLQEASILLL